MGIRVYYFSGTGNSLHVARELQRRIPEISLVPMLSLLPQHTIRAASGSVGFIYPIYLTTMPAPVQHFMSKFDAGPADYFFSVATRSGTLQISHVILNRILRRQGKHLDAFFTLNMANNSPSRIRNSGNQKWTYEVTQRKLEKLEETAQAKLDAIAGTITKKKRHIKLRIPNPFSSLFAVLINKLMSKVEKKIPFYADESCTGCGICEAVCPSEKVTMIEGGPVWQDAITCYYCYACFNFCPHQSVLVGSLYTKKEGRYTHPEVTAQDIARQKDR
jgi:ferredoxin